MATMFGASSSTTTHKIYLILLRRSKAFHWRQNHFEILQHIKNSRERFRQPPLLPRWGYMIICVLLNNHAFNTYLITVKPGPAYPTPPPSTKIPLFWKLNPSVVVDFRFISSFMLDDQWIYMQGSYAIFACSVFLHLMCVGFKAILSIQRFFILTEYKEVIVKKKLTAHHACRNADSNLIHICIDFLYYNPGQNVLGHLRKLGTNIIRTLLN